MNLDVPPQPHPDAETIGYWEAASRSELSMARCVECRRWQHPPLERCPACRSAIVFEPLAGTGSVFSYIDVHQPCVPGFLDDLPYRVVLVELDDQPGLRLASSVARSAPALAVGDRVRVELVPLPGGDFQVPQVRPA